MSNSQNKWDAFIDHILWAVLAGMTAPFLLALLLVPLDDRLEWRDLIRAGQLHLAAGGLLLAAIPSLTAVKGAKGWARLLWGFLAFLMAFVMLGSVVVWSRLSSIDPTKQSNDQWSLASWGGLSAMFLGAFLSSALVWKSE